MRGLGLSLQLSRLGRGSIMVRFISKYIGGTEWVTITVNNVIKYSARKVDTFNPFWILFDSIGNKVDEFKSLATMQTAIESREAIL